MQAPGRRSSQLRSRSEKRLPRLEKTWFHSMTQPAESAQLKSCCAAVYQSDFARKFARVIRPGGQIGMSDLTRSGPLPEDLKGLLAWIACIADARPVEEYAGYLEAAGFEVTTVELHNSALAEMARDVQGRLLGMELMVKLKKLDLPGADFEQAKQVARAAMRAIQQGLLGYGLIVARLQWPDLVALHGKENSCS